MSGHSSSSSSSIEEISITLFHPLTSRTDAISVVPNSTTLSDLSAFAAALLGLDDGGRGGVVLARGQSRSPLYHPGGGGGSVAGGGEGGDRTLAQCGLSDGEFVSAYGAGEFERAIAAASASSSSPARQRPRTNASNAGGGGGMDFSALLGGAAAAASAPSASRGNNGGAGAGGMDFSALLSAGAASSSSSAAAASSSSGGNAAGSSSSASTPGRGPVRWDGMNLDDAIARNPNPVDLMTILSDSARHPNLLKELNYHNPAVYRRLAAAGGDLPKMAEVWRQTMMRNTTARFLQDHLQKSKEVEMRNRLAFEPMDAEANAYFGDKIRKENVQRQYEQMMEEYPESMGRVLMLYLECSVNKKHLQVFVDSGAQSTIMSSACADRLGLLHLVDNRFAGVAVGVGTGKILGKIHMVELEIGGYAFPCSITVMDSEQGLGDKNMDCLFGLDMLKRHRCCIDLAKSVLRFALGGAGEVMEAPFLHEKDLPKSKGGTMDFDAEKENAEVEARLEKMETDDDDEGGQDGKDGGEGRKKEDNGGDGNDGGGVK